MLVTSGEHMWSSLRQTLVTHPGELGQGREAIVRAFLSRYLPKRYGVSTGFVFDSRGAVSQQMDVVIYDELDSPVFLTAGEVRYFPCEAVVCVGQVKSSLTSRKLLEEALTNLRSVKVLDRTADGRNMDREAGEELSPKTNYKHQIHTFLFVAGRCLSEDTMRGLLSEHVDATSPHLWPNVLFAFDKFLLTYACDGGFCPNAMHAKGIACIRGPDRALLLRWFLYFVSRAAMFVTVPWFEYASYIGRFPRGSNSLYTFEGETINDADFDFDAGDGDDS